MAQSIKPKAEWWERGFLKMLDRLTVGKIMLFDDANIIKSFIRKVVDKEREKIIKDHEILVNTIMENYQKSASDRTA